MRDWHCRWAVQDFRRYLGVASGVIVPKEIAEIIWVSECEGDFVHIGIPQPSEKIGFTLQQHAWTQRLVTSGDERWSRSQDITCGDLSSRWDSSHSWDSLDNVWEKEQRTNDKRVRELFIRRVLIPRTVVITQAVGVSPGNQKVQVPRSGCKEQPREPWPTSRTHSSYLVVWSRSELSRKQICARAGILTVPTNRMTHSL